ncbi:Myosin 10A, isoform D [Gonapodya sp. JEL0774]|nr:Myosin 10A, isoform D [Gonapodya sp. JEL0774]
MTLGPNSLASVVRPLSAQAKPPAGDGIEMDQSLPAQSDHTKAASKAPSTAAATVATLGTDDKAHLAKSFFESRYKGGTVRKNVMVPLVDPGSGPGDEAGSSQLAPDLAAVRGEDGSDVRRSATAKLTVRPKSLTTESLGSNANTVRNRTMKDRTFSQDLGDDIRAHSVSVGEDGANTVATPEATGDGANPPVRRSWYSHYRTGSRADRDSLAVASLSSELPADMVNASFSEPTHTSEPSAAGEGHGSRMVSSAHARGPSRSGTLRPEGSVIYNYSDLWFEQIAATLANESPETASSPVAPISDAKKAIGGIMAVDKWFVVSPTEAEAMQKLGVDIRTKGKVDDVGKVVLDTSVYDAQELKRQEIIYETLVTEKEYVRDLKIIIDLYLKVMREKKILPPKGIAIVFSNIEQILPVNVELLARLEDRRIRSGGIVKEVGDVFLELASYLKMYTV